MNIHIGIPQHGENVSAATMRSILDAVHSKAHRVTYQALGLSLLARNFNALWINAYRSGADVFILHHADLGAGTKDSSNWVDNIVDLMYRTGGAMMSVASPIKSPAGHFSMGLDLKAGNSHTLRRTTARELFCMPSPFITRGDLCEMYDIHSDAAGAMIVNTGLLAMDLRRYPWGKWRWPGFNIVDSIEWSVDDIPQAFTEPEDWFASRWLHKRNIPFYTTKDLVLDHHGGQTYWNQGLWGMPADNTPRQPSIEEWTSRMWKGAKNA